VIDGEFASFDAVQLSIAEVRTDWAVFRDVLLDEALAEPPVGAGVTALAGARGSSAVERSATVPADDGPSCTLGEVW